MRIVRKTILLVLLLLFMLVTACQQTPVSLPTPTRLNTLTPLPPTSTPTITLTPTITPTPTVTPTPFAQAGIFDLIQGVDGVLPGTLTGMQINRNTLWLFSNKGAAWRSLSDTTFNKVLFKTTLLGVDANNLLWTHDPAFGTISAWDGIRWKEFSEKEGWLIGTQLAHTPLINTVFSDAQGATWLGVSWGAARFYKGTWTRFPFYQMGFKSPVACTSRSLVFASATDGTVWAGSCLWKDQQPIGEGGLSRFDGTAWHRVDLPEESSCVTALSPDPAGGLWVGTSVQLLYLPKESKKFEIFSYPFMEKRGSVSFVESIRVDLRGEPWLGFSLCNSNNCGQLRALYLYHNGEWSQIGEVTGWLLEPVNFDARENAWVMTDKAVYIYSAENLEKVSDMLPVAGALDSAGNLWLLAWFDGSTGLWSTTK